MIERIAAERPASRSESPTTKIEPATIQPRAIMLPVRRPATVRGSSDARARFSITYWTPAGGVQPTAAPAQPSSGRSGRDEDRQRQATDGKVEVPQHAQRHGGIGCFQSVRRQEVSGESVGRAAHLVLSTRAPKGT